LAAYRRHEPAKRAELPAAGVFITVEAVEWGEDIGKFTRSKTGQPRQGWAPGLTS